MSADIVGYSRMMGADEAGTLARLNASRTELFGPTIDEYKGRIVKLMGDGGLVEFASVVDAVECAITIQQGAARRNAGTPEDQRIDLRIGINLGDIITEGDDIYGDGVNIAARILETAKIGGVALSSVAWDQIDGKLDAGFEDAGERDLKNIAKSARIYHWSDGASVRAEVRDTTSTPPMPDKPSVAILPFENNSGDAEQGYFADGLTENIITGLTRFQSLFVIAVKPIFFTREKGLDAVTADRELSVAHIVDGCVRKAGNRVRVTAQLVEADTGRRMWAETYDRDLEDIFIIQDEITDLIVATVVGRMEDAAASARNEKMIRKWLPLISSSVVDNASTAIRESRSWRLAATLSARLRSIRIVRRPMPA